MNAVASSPNQNQNKFGAKFGMQIVRHHVIVTGFQTSCACRVAKRRKSIFCDQGTLLRLTGGTLSELLRITYTNLYNTITKDLQEPGGVLDLSLGRGVLPGP